MFHGYYKNNDVVLPEVVIIKITKYIVTWIRLQNLLVWILSSHLLHFSVYKAELEGHFTPQNIVAMKLNLNLAQLVLLSSDWWYCAVTGDIVQRLVILSWSRPATTNVKETRLGLAWLEKVAVLTQNVSLDKLFACSHTPKIGQF